MPTVLDKHVARIGIGRIVPEIKPEWLMAAEIEGTLEDLQIIQMTRTGQIHWCGTA